MMTDNALRPPREFLTQLFGEFGRVSEVGVVNLDVPCDDRLDPPADAIGRLSLLDRPMLTNVGFGALLEGGAGDFGLYGFRFLACGSLLRHDVDARHTAVALDAKSRRIRGEQFTGGESGIRNHSTVRAVNIALTSLAGIEDRISFAPETS